MAAVSTARDAVASATAALEAAGCDTPRLDAELLIAGAMGVGREALYTDPAAPLDPRATRIAMEWVRRRLAREPVAYITGRRGFRRIELHVDRRVLIPRPETELLVEIGLTLPRGARVHDVGTGCGAVALALKHERPDLVVSASDISRVAVDVARENAERLGLDVDVVTADGLPPGDYDLVTANLPYVRDDQWDTLQPEISGYEPPVAFLGGSEGLDHIRALVAAAHSGTLVALEHAPAQAEAIRGMLESTETPRDLAGCERVTVGRVP